MADALLSVEVITKLDQLSAGLRRAEGEIISFVSKSNMYLGGLKNTLASLGFDKSASGARAFTSALRDQNAEIMKQSRALSSLSTVLNNNANANAKNVNAINNSNQAMSRGTGQVGAFIASYLSLQGAISAAMFAFNQNIKVDAIKTSLTYLLGSSEEMEIRWERLKEKANAYGVSVTDLGNAYQLFIGSAKAANQDLEVAEKVFYSVSKAGAVLHLSQEKLASALYAVQQMMDKGTVQSEELKRQLGNALPGAMATMGKAVAAMTGRVSVSNDELMKMMKNGEIISSEVLPFFAQELEKTFGLDKIDKVKSLQASVGNLGNALTNLVADGSKVSSFFSAIVDGLTHTTNRLNDLVNSSSWKEFVLRMFQPQNTDVADRIRDIGKAAGEVAKQSNRITALDLTAQDKERLKAEYAAIAKTLNKMVNPYNAATNDAKNGVFGHDPKVLREAKLNYDYLQSKLGQIKMLMAGMPDVAKNNPPKITIKTDDALTSIKEIKARIAELSKMDGSAVKGSDIANRIKALKARLSTRSGDAGPTKEERDALKAREEWNKKVAESIKATGEYIIRTIENTAEAEVEAEKKRIDDLNAVLETSEVTNATIMAGVDKPREEEAQENADRLDNFHSFVDGMVEEANRFVGDAVGMFAEGIGMMLAGELSFADFGKGMLAAMGDFLSSFGKQLIAFATASLLFTKLKLAIKAGGPGAIPAAIALIGAGIALTVIGSAISSSMGGGRGGGGDSDVPGFANGVTNFGGGLAIVGERGPELVSLPKGSSVTPSSKTERLLQGSTEVFIPDMVLKGEDIYVSFNKAKSRLDRI